jgi:hypothetical protein
MLVFVLLGVGLVCEIFGFVMFWFCFLVVLVVFGLLWVFMYHHWLSRDTSAVCLYTKASTKADENWKVLKALSYNLLS